MSLVSGFQYTKARIMMPLNNTPNYNYPAAVAVLDVGKYLVLYSQAIVGSTNGTSISFNTLTLYTDIGGVFTLLAVTPKTNTNTVDSSGILVNAPGIVAPPQPCVIYRTIENTVNITTPNTSLVLSWNNTMGGGVTQQSSTASQDDFYSYIHFLKIA
jgi:hypothetical protein